MGSNNRDLTARLGLDSSKFKKGSNEVKAELTELNTAMLKNRREQKELESQIKELSKQQKLNKQSTAEEKKQYEELTQKIDKATLELAELKTEEQELRGQIKATNKELESQGESAQKISEAYKNVGKVLKTGAALTGTALAGMFSYTANIAASADEINTLSKQTGLATDEIQKFMYASELIDVSLDTLTGSMSKLIRNMNAASEGTGEAYDAFSALGVSVTDNAGVLRNNQDVFYECIDALSKIQEETQRDAYAMAIFGKSAQDLNPLILGGTEQLKAFGDELEREGLILSQSELDKLNEFNDKIDTFNAKFQATMAEGALQGVDALEDLFEKSDQIVDLIASLITGFAKLSGFIIDNKDAVLSLVIAYGAYKVAMNVGSLISSVVVALKSLITHTKTAKTAQEGMNAACNANPYVLLASVLVGLVGSFIAFNASVEETETTYQRLNKSINESVAETKAETELLKEKGKRYEELRQKVKRTTEEESELYKIAAELEAAYPNQIELIGETAGAYKELGDQIEIVSEELIKQSQIKATSNALEQALTEKYSKAAELYDMYVDFLNSDKIFEYSGINNESDREKLREYFETAWSEYKSVEYDFLKLSDESKKALYGLNGVFVGDIFNKNKDKFFLDPTKSSPDASEESKKSALLIEELADNQEGIAMLKKEYSSFISVGTESTDDFSGAVVSLADAMSRVESNTQTVNDAEKEFAETNELSTEILNNLVKAYPELQNEVNDYLSGIITAETVINHLNIAYQHDVENNTIALQSKLDADKEYYQKLKTLNNSAISELANEYGLDLTKYEEYGEAKLAIQSEFLSKMSSNWHKYYDAKSGSYIIDDKDLMLYKKELMASGLSAKEANEEVQRYKDEYYETRKAVSAWETFKKSMDSDITDYAKWYMLQLTPEEGGEEDDKSNNLSQVKKVVSSYQLANEAFKKLTNDRIEEIQKLTDAENNAADERIAAIEKEISAREKLRDTSDLQERIDFIKGQLKYSQLEEFERFELQRQLESLEEEQKDKAWLDAKNAEIEALQAQKSARDKETSELIEQLKANQNYANTVFTDLNNGYQSTSSIINNNTQQANVNIITDALSLGQVEQVVKNAIGLGLII